MIRHYYTYMEITTHLLLLVLLFLELLLWLFLWHSWQPTITVEGSLIKSVDKLDDLLGLVLDELTVVVGKWCSSPAAAAASVEHWGQESKCWPPARGWANTEWDVSLVVVVEVETTVEAPPPAVDTIAELARLLLWVRLRRVEAMVATSTTSITFLFLVEYGARCAVTHNLEVTHNAQISSCK